MSQYDLQDAIDKFNREKPQARRDQYVVHVWPRDLHFQRPQYNDARAIFKNNVKDGQDCAIWHCLADGTVKRLHATADYRFKKLYMEGV